jgi:predicted transcriptional regulator
VQDAKDDIIISELFSEFASETRCSILMSLYMKPSKISSLARELYITPQEAFRNINRLMEANLIKRGNDDLGNSGVFSLTELGGLVIRQFPYFLVIRKYQEVLEDHTIESVPDKFVHRLGVLKNCIVINNVTAVFEKLKKLEINTKKCLRIMVAEAWPEEGRILADRASNGVDVLAMFGSNTVFPKEVIDNVIPTIDRLEKSGKIKRRMLDTVKLAIYISDSESAVMLPNLKGEVDMTMLIVGKDITFNEWCLDMFNYFWELAGPARLDKVKVV